MINWDIPFKVKTITVANDNNYHCILFCLPDASVLPASILGLNREGAILLDGVLCNGSEARILDCISNPIGSHDCSHDDDVILFCEGILITLPNYYIGFTFIVFNIQSRIFVLMMSFTAGMTFAALTLIMFVMVVWTVWMFQKN